jgi:hypothetical protein
VLNTEWPPLCINRPRHLFSICCHSKAPVNPIENDWEENSYAERVKVGLRHSHLEKSREYDEIDELIFMFRKLRINSEIDEMSVCNQTSLPDEKETETESLDYEKFKQEIQVYLDTLRQITTFDQFFNDLGFYGKNGAHFDCFYEEVFDNWRENDDVDDYYSCPCYCYLDPLKDCDH